MDLETFHVEVQQLHETTTFLDRAYQEELRRVRGPFTQGTHYDHLTRNMLNILYGYYELSVTADPAASEHSASFVAIFDALKQYLIVIATREDIRTVEMSACDGILGEKHMIKLWEDMILDRAIAVIEYAEQHRTHETASEQE